MEIVTPTSLARGAAIVEFAFGDHGSALDLSATDAVAVVAAYIARGGYPEDIEEELGRCLTPAIGRQAARAYEMFEDYRGRGLWDQGPTGEIAFTHPLLNETYPVVRERHEQFLRSIPSL